MEVILEQSPPKKGSLDRCARCMKQTIHSSYLWQSKHTHTLVSSFLSRRRFNVCKHVHAIHIAEVLAIDVKSQSMNQ